MGISAENGDTSAQTDAVEQFYAALLGPVGNPRITTALAVQARWLGWLRRTSLSDASAARISFAEKQAFAAALFSRDAAQARHLCEVHLDRAADRVRRALISRLTDLSGKGADETAA